jgi:hypothetical protein
MYSKLFFIVLFAPLFATAQNVGVGTTTPASRLHVVDSTNNVLRLWLQAPTLATSETRLELNAGTNPFSSLFLIKYAPGNTGSLAGVSKDNLSAVSTGGNAGPLLLHTGDGNSPLLFAAGITESMRITANGKVGIGTATPSIQNRLHVHNSDPSSGVDVSIGISNSITTDANGRGARLRMLGNDFGIINNEVTGRLTFSTTGNQRLVITPTGNIGINNLNPAYLLDIEANGGSRAVNINQTGSSSSGMEINATGFGTSNRGIFINNPANSSLPSNYTIGVHAVSGSGSAISLSPTNNYGLIGECRNPAEGYGVLGISNSPSSQIRQAAVVGINFSSAASTYGVIGTSSGTSGAGTVGYTENGAAGLLGYADPASTGPAIKSVSEPGSAKIGLELENGAIKVSGANRTVFRHVATAANINTNETIIPNTTLANSATDLLIVTPFWDGVYLNAAIGVYFEATSGTWRIFRQDFGNIPVNAKFNVMVVKQ